MADLLGENLLRGVNPTVATYARADGLDVRISAVDEAPGAGASRTARELADEAEAEVLAVVGGYVWGRDHDTWPAAIGRRLAASGWRLAVREIGTGGAFVRLLGDVPWLIHGEFLSDGSAAIGVELAAEDEAAAEALRSTTGADVGLVVRARLRGDDTGVLVAFAAPGRVHRERRIVFLGGDMGRQRSGLTAAAVLFEQLERVQPPNATAEPAMASTAESLR
jgi:hypothetical protein